MEASRTNTVVHCVDREGEVVSLLLFNYRATFTEKWKKEGRTLRLRLKRLARS